MQATAWQPDSTEAVPGDPQRMEELGEQLQVQAAHLAAAEYRWLVLLEEFDRGGGWAQQGAKTCAQWLSWACGMTPGTARDRLRVAHALAGLPVVSAAFAAGRLSYSKVRAIVRVATPENEQVLVNYGLSATASQLEQVVRHHRQLLDLADEQRVVEQRQVTSRDLGNGMTRITMDFPHEDARRAVAVIDEWAVHLGEDEPPPSAAVAPSRPEQAQAMAEGGVAEVPVASHPLDVPPPVAVRRADAVLAMIDTAQAHGPTPVGGPDRYQLVINVRGGSQPNDAGAADRDARAVLPDGTVVGASGPLEEPAAAASGVPAAVRPPVAAAELPGEWPAPAPAAWPGPMPAAWPGPMPAAWLEDGTMIGALTAQMLACDAKVVWLIEDDHGAPVGVTEQTRTIPRWVRRALRKRDKGCRFPGCTNKRFVDAHHVWYWSNGGPTVLWNLVFLCRFHHGLVHRAGYRIYAYGDQTFSFHTPDGRLIPEARPSPGGDADEPARRHAEVGLDLTADSLVPDWDGIRPDYDLAAEVLWRATFPHPDDDPFRAADDIHSVSAETRGGGRSVGLPGAGSVDPCQPPAPHLGAA